MTTVAHESSAAPAQPAAPARITGPQPGVRVRLLFKYILLIFALLLLALITNGGFEICFSYQEHKASLVRIQREQAEAAAAKIGQFIKEIESQLGWTTQLTWSRGGVEPR